MPGPLPHHTIVMPFSRNSIQPQIALFCMCAFMAFTMLPAVDAAASVKEDPVAATEQAPAASDHAEEAGEIYLEEDAQVGADGSVADQKIPSTSPPPPKSPQTEK